ncbi:hypothetical protein KUTeg_001784 [Tegillarca granosa]|uniref:PH domain-containing protein n=1 Tax=Tegillarca granosa TaxID=220873 RepID=A0ABQ9FSG0_TEGGR|nr:hypothetical protein KUTeg_001784 [Tegillarca granosa]
MKTSSDDDDDNPPREVSSLEIYKELLQLRFLQIRSRMTREQTFSPEMKYEISQMNGMKSMVERLKHVTMSDLVLPDHTGWLIDQSDNSKNYCIIADMLFCIFEDEIAEHPKDVILLPGCSIRSLVYQTPDSTTSQSKTISGIDRYQIVINDSGSKKKYLFSVETDTELLEWMAALKTSSNLDQDVGEGDVSNSSVEPRRHSICYDPSVQRHGTQGSYISPKYVPSPKSSTRTILQAFSGTENLVTDSVIEKDSSSNSVPIDNFRRRLRRDTDQESSKPTPMKATYFTESPSSAHKKLSPFKRFRSFGSLESLFKPKRRNNKDKRYKKLYVFKLAQQGKKSHYFNATDNAELSKWIQTLQMEAIKVQTDPTEIGLTRLNSSDSFQSIDSSSTMSSQSPENSKPRRRTNTLQSDLPNLCKFVPNSEGQRRGSMPTTLTPNVSENNIEGSSSSDNWQTSENDEACVKNGFGLPGEGYPGTRSSFERTIKPCLELYHGTIYEDIKDR